MKMIYAILLSLLACNFSSNEINDTTTQSQMSNNSEIIAERDTNSEHEGQMLYGSLDSSVLFNTPIAKIILIEKVPGEVDIHFDSKKITDYAIDNKTKEVTNNVLDDKKYYSDSVIILTKKNTGDIHLNDEIGQQKKFDHTHKKWDNITSKFISSNGNVNYSGIKKAENELNNYLSIISAQTPMKAEWSKSQKMAFWINAYNAFTIKLIVINYPLKSILDLEQGKVWDKQWIDIGGKTYSLNDIEHKVLRPIFKDSRIHFAVNCAAQSCPPIWNRAWTHQGLDENLDQRTKMFINYSKYNEITKTELKLSKIFEWYAVDFGDIGSYINTYSDVKTKANVNIQFKDYNWKLNE